MAKQPSGKNFVNHCGIILLAAGASTRLGKPKQLLSYKGLPLLQKMVNVATSTELNGVVVVLGANADLVLKEVDFKNAIVVLNTGWQQGMASSITTGVMKMMEKYPSTDGVIFIMCDQPFVSASLLKHLIIKQHETGKQIITSSYNNDTLGPPALFHKNLFPEILKLKGDAGGKKIVEQHIKEMTTVPFHNGNVDIDTIEEYEALLKIK